MICDLRFTIYAPLITLKTSYLTTSNLFLCMVVLCGLTSATATAATVTLAWDASLNATSYNLYQAVGTNAFSRITSVSALTATVASVDTTKTNRFYATAVNATGESPPSNIFLMAATVPPTVALVLTVPVLSSTNLTPGQTINATATVRNNGTASFTIAGGTITARRPGASNDSGPYDNFNPAITAQTLAPATTLAVSASWMVPTNGPTGQWRAFLTIQDTNGLDTDGPDSYFTVTTSTLPAPPPAPQNLRAISITASRLDLRWQNALAYGTKVERSVNTGNYNEIASLTPGILHYTAAVKRHTDYLFRVRAFDQTGLSDYSNALFFSAR